MAVSRAERRALREPRVDAIFGKQKAAVLDLLELLEFAWHDCYEEITPTDDLIDDILICSRGDMSEAVRAARLALEDWRDLKLWADDLRPPAEP